MARLRLQVLKIVMGKGLAYELLTIQGIGMGDRAEVELCRLGEMTSEDAPAINERPYCKLSVY